MDKESRKNGNSFVCFIDTQGRYTDFHALRKSFITNLSKSGDSPKMAQSLARHSDINLTMNVYADVVLEDQAVSMELLPELPNLLPASTSAPGILQHLAKRGEHAARKSVSKHQSV